MGIFSTKIKCGECGAWYGSKVWHSTDEYRKTIFRCNGKYKQDKPCGTPHLTEDEIKALFISAVNKLLSEKAELIENLTLIQNTLFDSTALEAELKTLRDEVQVLVEMIQNCIAENARVAQDQTEYEERYNALVARYDTAKTRVEEVEAAISNNLARREMTANFIEALKRQDGFITDFDCGLWSNLVDYLTVYTSDDVRFTFKDGTVIQA